MCACAAWVLMRATHATDLARATARPTGGDGDGPLADGHTLGAIFFYRVAIFNALGIIED